MKSFPQAKSCCHCTVYIYLEVSARLYEMNKVLQSERQTVSGMLCYSALKQWKMPCLTSEMTKHFTIFLRRFRQSLKLSAWTLWICRDSEGPHLDYPEKLYPISLKPLKNTSGKFTTRYWIQPCANYEKDSTLKSPEL